MVQYIDKDAVMAEIQKLDALYHTSNDLSGELFIEGLFRFLDTSEVKEVDLEKELIEWHKEHFKKDRTFIGMSGFYLTNNSQMDIAKHFYELGLQARKEESE